MSELNPKRIRKLNNLEYNGGDVVYWMSRDQRVVDNWSLIFSQASALKYKKSLHVVFCLQEEFLEAQNDFFNFMIEGLEEVYSTLRNLNIKFTILKGEPYKVLPKYILNNNIGIIFSDFSPLKIMDKWLEDLIPELKIPIWQVDSHNIVPVWETSDKQEYAARTIRPKINKKLGQYLTPFNKLVKHPHGEDVLYRNPFDDLQIYRKFRTYNLKPGTSNALEMLETFVTKNLRFYSEQKNDPTKNVLSNLSPYLHFGQISSQTVALELQKHKPLEDVDVFLEELIIRKELAENFCYYNKKYDQQEGFPKWAQETLDKHKKDKRPYLYNLEQFEKAQTHSDAWNAAQLELVKTGKIHGYIRMYWAKKILEWSESPKVALRIAIYLNDKYSLDGRDPNGYSGIAWSIGGVHDRPWFERKIYGKVRYMNSNGLRRKFDLDRYIQKYIKI